jgi:hypothetical protein
MRNIKVRVVKLLLLGVAMLMLGASNVMAQINVSLPDITRQFGAPDEDISVTVGSLTGQNVFSGSFTVTYDTSVVYLTGINKVGTILGTGGILEFNADTAKGQITVVWANSEAYSGSGTLLKLKAKFRNYGTSPLSFDDTFLFNEGTPAANETDGSVMIPAIAVKFSDVTAAVGDTIFIPVTTSALTALNGVHSYEFDATFDPAVLSVEGIQITGTLSSEGIAEYEANNLTGTLAVSYAGSVAIVGSGDLILIKVAIKSADTSSIDFTSFQFNEGTPSAGTVSGILITTAKVIFINAMPNSSVNEMDTLTYDYNATAGIGDTVVYALVAPAPAGAAINAATGVFTWVPTYDQSGVDTIIVSASVGTNVAVDTAFVTVVNVNRNPVFVKQLSASTNVRWPEPGKLTFQYTATDADGDALTFSFVGRTEAKATITTDGLFVYTATDTTTVDEVTIKVIDGNGGADTSVTVVSSLSDIDPNPTTLPTQFSLDQNYPNPFNPSTAIRFQLPKESHVTLKVFSLLGEEVSSMVNEYLTAGYHEYKFDASNLSTGIYIYRIQAGDFVSTKKMTLIK